MTPTRVTRIESFRRVLSGWGDEAALLRDLQGNPDPPSWQMEAGTAFHDLLSDLSIPVGIEGPDVYLESGHWLARAGDINFVRCNQGPGLREVTATGMVGPLLVSGTCDLIHGSVIRDTKCKFSPVDARDYETSLQWRFYLHLFEADCFAYDLLAFRTDLQNLELLDIVTVRFWRYDGLERDCIEWAERFAEWCARREAA